MCVCVCISVYPCIRVLCHRSACSVDWAITGSASILVWPGWSPDVATSSLPPPLMSLVKPEDNLSCYAMWQQDENDGDGGNDDRDRDKDLKEFPRMESKDLQGIPTPCPPALSPPLSPGQPYLHPLFHPSLPNPSRLIVYFPSLSSMSLPPLSLPFSLIKSSANTSTSSSLPNATVFSHHCWLHCVPNSVQCIFSTQHIICTEMPCILRTPQFTSCALPAALKHHAWNKRLYSALQQDSQHCTGLQHTSEGVLEVE